MSMCADHPGCRNLQECRSGRGLIAIDVEEGSGSGSGAMGVADTAGEEPTFLVSPTAIPASAWTRTLSISCSICHLLMLPNSSVP